MLRIFYGNECSFGMYIRNIEESFEIGIVLVLFRVVGDGNNGSFSSKKGDFFIYKCN